MSAALQDGGYEVVSQTWVIKVRDIHQIDCLSNLKEDKILLMPQSLLVDCVIGYGKAVLHRNGFACKEADPNAGKTEVACKIEATLANLQDSSNNYKALKHQYHFQHMFKGPSRIHLSTCPGASFLVCWYI